MKLISPLIMFISCGSSSRLVLLKNAPNFVSLLSSGSNSPFSSLASVIVLNLYKQKIFSFFPGLFCLNITGEPRKILTNTATIIERGKVKINNNVANIKSKILFIYFEYILTPKIKYLKLTIIIIPFQLKFVLKLNLFI